MTWWSAAEYQRFCEELLRDLEDDGLGVYEAWWTANSRFPERPLSDRLALAEAALAELVKRGLVRLYRGEWIGQGHDREVIDEGEVDSVLRQWATWVPETGAVVWVHRRIL